MKKISFATIVLALALAAAGAFAQQKKSEMNCKDMKGMDMKCTDMKDMAMDEKPAATKHAVHVAKGTVTKVDSDTGTVTVAHEPVKSLKWPAMSMGFKVKDKMLLEKFTVGREVQIKFEQEGKDFVVTSVK